jgi:hypothetical protein
MIPAAYFVANNLLLAAASVWLAQWAVGHRESWRMALVAIANFALLAFAIGLALGLSGWLSPPGALAGSGIVAAAARFARTRRTDPPRDSGGFWGSLTRALEQRRGLTLVAVALLAAPIGLLALEASLKATTLYWDDFSYHAAALAHWLTTGQIELAPFAYQLYYPFNAEMLALWFMLPFQTDAYASLTALYWTLLGTAAVGSIAVATGRSLSSAALLAAVFVSSTYVTFAGRTFAAVDLAGPTLLMAAMALWLSEAAQPRDRTRDALYSGALAGLAVGCKSTFAPAGILLFVWWLAFGRVQSAIQERLRLASLFVLGGLLTGSAWYLRNLLLTGNPLFPAEVGPFAGPFDAASLQQTTLFYVLTQRDLPGDKLLQMLRTAIDWPLASACIAAVGYALALVTLIKARLGGVRWTATAELYALLVVMGLTSLLMHPFMPFSGTIDQPEPFTRYRIMPRYLILAFTCGIVLFGSTLRIRRFSVIAVAALLGAYAFSIRWETPKTAILLALAAVAGAAAIWIAARLPARIATRAAWAVVIVWLIGLAGYYPIKHARTSEAIAGYGMENRPVGHGWLQLEKLDPGSTVAFYMSEPENYTLYYPVFGRKLQLRPVPLDPQGRPRQLLHVTWTEQEGGWWHDWVDRNPDVSAATFFQNVKAAGVDYVLVSRWSIGEWPAQHRLLEESGLASLEYDDGYSALWQIP